MRLLSATSALVLMLCGTAQAADLEVAATAPEAASKSWTGLYLGTLTGFGMSQNALNVDDVFVWDGMGTKGSAAGGLVGVDVDLGNGLVAGGEVSAMALGLTSNATLTVIDLAGGEFETYADWMARLSGRLGVVVSEDTLLYGTVGVSTYHAGIRASVLGGPDQGVSDYYSVMASVGVGIETRIGQRWRLRGEYTTDFFPEITFEGLEDFTVQGQSGLMKASVIYSFGDDTAPVAQVVDAGRWQGLYLGASGGETLSVSQLVIDAGAGDFSTDGIGSQGWTAGVHAGGNVVIADSLLLGAEVGLSASTAEATQSVSYEDEGGTLHEANKYWAEARIRAGIFANPDALVYVLAGMTRAHGEVWAESSEGDLPAQDFDRNGYVAGTGIEALLGDNLSARIEYTYTFYDDVDLAGPDAYVSQDQQTATVGLSYLLR